MERGETVHMVLFAAGLLRMVAENHEEGNDEIEDEDDKVLLSKPFPESQSKLQLQFHEEKNRMKQFEIQMQMDISTYWPRSWGIWKRIYEELILKLSLYKMTPFCL